MSHFDWVTTGNWSETNDVITVTGGGSATVENITFAKGRVYTPQFEVIGVFGPAGFIELTLNTNVLAITTPGVKVFNIEADESGRGFSFASAGSDFIGSIEPLIFALATPGEGTIQDEILRATGGPALATGLGVWFSQTDNESLQDAEYRWLLEQPETGTSGTIADLWFEFLRASGFTGGLPAMKLAYWTGQP